VRIDARKKPCPQPVVMTKKALDSIKEGQVITIVDNEVAKENISKFARSQDLDFKVDKSQEDYIITITKGKVALHNTSVDIEDKKDEGYCIIFSKDTFGSGERELGNILIRSFIYTLKDASKMPSTLIFVNSGVNLTTEGSEVIGVLKELEEKGVKILSCGTCLDYYNLKEKLQVGSISNMYEIMENITLQQTLSL